MEEGPDHNPGRRIRFNVGGRLFETTAATVLSGGPESLLAALSSRSSSDVIFIDRDPDLFAPLLSLLRSDRLPSAARRLPDLIDEARYYGLDPRLRLALAPPPLAGADASLAATLVPAADALPSALSAADGSLWVAHGGQISVYDWSLAHAGTFRTHLDAISAMGRAWPEIAALGSEETPGLHFYDVASGRHVGSAHWSDPADTRVYKARVAAVAADPVGPAVFASFECPHRENSILAIDRTTLQVVSEIGRQSGGASKSGVAGKVVHLPELGLLFASSVSRGAFGYAGYMRLWDPRSGEAVWETCEPGGSGRRFGDAFADTDVDVEGSAIYKVCWKSGDVGAADIRQLRAGEDGWFFLEEPRAELRNPGGGEDSIVLCYGRQVFVSREGGLEVWSPSVGNDNGDEDDNEGVGKGYRRNYVDSEADGQRGVITRMAGSGDRLFLSREGMEGVEVWESSDLSAAVALS